MNRRNFLQLLASAAFSAGCGAPAPRRREPAPGTATGVRVDLAIAGGGLGGCAAALAAAQAGLRVLVLEETDWIGGQLTSQAVPPDEHRWIERFGATASYRELRERIRAYYRRNFPLVPALRDRADLNPGNGWVSRLCCEPRVALAALEEMLAPHVAGGRVRILPQHVVVAADVAGDRVRSLRARGLLSGRELVVEAPYFLDATELGDVLPLAGVEHVTGAESRRETGELHAPEVADPDDHQAFTHCFAVDYLHGEDHTIERPRDYAFWRDYVPDLTPPWTGRLLSWTAPHAVTLEPRTFDFDPREGSGLWSYRRIADRSQFRDGTYPGDISLINWPQNDYLEGNLVGVSPVDVRRHVESGRQLSLSLLYWLQTEAPRPDDGHGWPGLRLRADVVGTEDGLAKYPYIREARRIRAVTTVKEQHVGEEARAELAGKPRSELTAEPFLDSVGVGSYRIDLHPSTGGKNYIDIPSLPFRIPLGALLPVRVENLIPAAKNIGTTHITNGCYRLHPVEWNIGEAAGALVAFCLRERCRPAQVREREPLLEAYQKMLVDRGVELAWPDDLRG